MGTDELSPERFAEVKNAWAANDVNYLAMRKDLARSEMRTETMRYDASHVADKFTPTQVSIDHGYVGEDQKKWASMHSDARAATLANAYDASAGDIDRQVVSDLALTDVSSLQPDVAAPGGATLGVAYAAGATILADHDPEKTGVGVTRGASGDGSV